MFFFFRNFWVAMIGVFVIGGIMSWGLLRFLPRPSVAEPTSVSPGPAFSSGTFSKFFYEEAYAPSKQVASVKTRSFISPHHLLVASNIARVFSVVADEQVKTVVLISPNHFSAGKSVAQTTQGYWETPYGNLEVDTRGVEKLTEVLSFVRKESTTFKEEHGIFALVPFVKRSFPRAQFIPLALHETMTADQAEQLGEQIAQLFPDAVVIASIDFSHYLPEVAASFHDEVSRGALERAGCAGCMLEMDANAVSQTLAAVNESRKAQMWHEITRTSSVSLGVAARPEENTSHLVGYFTEGVPKTGTFAALHVVGDIMLDRDVRKAIDREGVQYPWQHVTRFLSGSHMVIGNLEGTISTAISDHAYDAPYRFLFDPSFVKEMHQHVDVVSLANNHAGDRLAKGERETRAALEEMAIPWFGSFGNNPMRLDKEVGGVPLTLIGYHAFVPNEPALQQEIRRARADGRFVIVYPHWGTEYALDPDAQQRRLATLMSEAGAQMVIGGHPHVAQGFEMIDQTFVAWSLGNFVFDQPMPETWPALTLGVIINDDQVQVRLLPVWTKNGAPIPMTDKEARQWFATWADHSSPELRASVQSGVLSFPYSLSPL